MIYKIDKTGAQIEEALNQVPINQENIEAVEDKIPQDASGENKLADKAYVDSEVEAAKNEVIGDAGTGYNTLGKAEDKIQEEAARATEAENALDGRVDTLETAVGTGGSVDERIATAKSEVIGDAGTDYNTLGKVEDKIQEEAARATEAENALDGRVETLETAVGTGGSVDERIATAKSEVIGDAGTGYNTLGKAEDKIQEEAARATEAENALDGRVDTLETAVGTGGSVDERIATAKSEVIGDAGTDYNTLGKAEDKIQEEAARATEAENALDGRVDTLETAVGTGGSVDERIATAKSELTGDAGTDYNTLGKVEDKIQEEAARATAAELLLQQQYNALQQSNPVIVEPTDTWPVASPEQSVIYRVVDRVNTPPTYYQDYMYNGTSMILMAQYDNAIDDNPTPGSTNLVKSGGVAASVVFDVSEANNGATFADLNTLLTDANLSTLIPTSVRKGGMSIKFVHTSDNKYVQYRLMATSFSTTESNWETVLTKVTDGEDDFSISDEDGNAIAQFQEGHIKTSNFNSKTVKEQIVNLNEQVNELIRNGGSDFSVSDEESNDIVQFNNGHIKTLNFDSKTVKEQIVNLNEQVNELIRNGGSDFSVSDEESNDIVQFNNGHIKTLNFDSENALRRIEELEQSGGDLNLYLPTYVFGIESGDSFGGREYFTSLYPEAMVKSLGINLKLNGHKKYNFQRTRWASTSYIHNVDTEVHTIKVSAKGYNEGSMNVNYVRANRYNAKNKPIHLLCIGDSITEQEQMDFYYSGKWNMVGAYPAWAQKLALEDNADIGNISIDLLGTRYIHTHEWDYNGTAAATHHLTATTHDEGRRGWRIHTYMQSPIDFLDAQKTYYLSGLATKTPYDSNTPGQAYTSVGAYVGSHGWGGLYDLMYATPMGRYKPDWNADLWELFKSFPAFTGTGDYDQSTSDALMASFWENILVNPKAILGDLTSTLDTTTCYVNPFYDVTKARAYTASHNWTNNNAFNFAKWLERYRTCDDLGVRLSGSAGESVTGSDGNTYTIGTWVDDAATSPYEVYKPTHIILAVGINDEFTETGYGTAYESLLQAVASYDNSIPIGYFMHRRAGVIEPQDWQDYGILTKKAYIDYNHDAAMQALHPTLNISNQLTYIPSYFTESAVAGSCARISYDFDDGIEVKKIVAGADNVHTSSFTQKSIGYQCLAWVYWTLQ